MGKYTEGMHTTHIGLLNPATDREIWNWAKKNNYTILTNDIDFEHLLTALNFPPKVIILLTKYQSINYIASILLSSSEMIFDFLKDTEIGLLEIN
jgi:predicted nuclease of predicted toxin-antitoxin system